MEELVLPNTVDTFYNPLLSGYIGKIVIKSKLTNSFSPGVCYGTSLHGRSAYTFVLDIDEVQVAPSTASSAYRNNHYYYVPDDLLSTYLATSGWSNITSGHILPMSNLTE